MSKVKRNTRKHLNRYRREQELERVAERKAQRALQQVPPRFRKQDRELEKMTEGVTW